MFHLNGIFGGRYPLNLVNGFLLPVLNVPTAGTSLKNATFGQLNSSNSPFGLKQEEFYAGTQGHFWLIA